MINRVVIFSILVSLISFVVAFYFYRWIIKKDVENPRVKEISGLIAQGSRTFLKKSTLS